MKRFLLLAVLAAIFAILIATACGGGGSSASPQPGTVNVSMSDPPTCAGPSGAFTHVYVTIKDVKIHQSANASDSDAGWIDLTPSLSSAPKQVDLLGIADNTCFLAMLGSNTEIQPGSYQQIRIFLAPDSAAGAIAGNACGNNANCVVTRADGAVHPMDLSSEVQTGIKIPSGQLAGGAFVVAPGTQKDLNIDFDACASIIAQNNGRFRLKPVMHAGEVSLTATSVSGKLVDKNTNAPIVGGKGIVALETRDSVAGVNRVVMQTTPDANGNFVLCPVPAGSFDVVAVAVSGTGVAYAATVVTGVQAGNNVGNVPMIAQTGTNTSQTSITGQVTTTKGTATVADVTIAALQSITVSGATVNIVVPLAQQSSATATVATAAGGSCPANTACADYTLGVPAMQPNVGAFGTTITYTQAATTPVAYTVDALAFVQGSGGTPDCTPSEVKVSTVTGGAALNVTPGTTANAAVASFTSCQ